MNKISTKVESLYAGDKKIPFKAVENCLKIK